MTKEEKIIVSAYTGYLMCDSPSVLEYIDKILGRRVYMHELAEADIWKEIREKAYPDFRKLCEEGYP